MATNLGRKQPKDSRPNKGLVLQERWLTANYNALSLNEHRALLNKCLDVLARNPTGSTKWCLALFSGLSLISGRTQARLVALEFGEAPGRDEWWELDGDEAILFYRPQIIRNDLESLFEDSKYRQLVREVRTKAFPLPIPSPLAKYLAAWSKLGPFRRKEVSRVAGTIIKDLQQYELRPYSAGRIASALSYYLSTKKCGIAHIGYLTGLSPRRCVALHYSQLRVAEVLPPYVDFLEDLGFLPDKIPVVSDGVVGSALAVDEQALSWLFQEQVKPLCGAVLNDIGDYFHFHNEIAYMTWVYIQLSTGHRHNIGALKSVLHFDLVSGLLVVEDKTNRPHILSQSSVQQLEHYLNYLHSFRRVAELHNPGLANDITASLSGDASLLFLLDAKGKRKSFSVKNLKGLVNSFWPFPANWARHFTLTKLVTILPADQFPAWAGHLEGEKEADDRFSNLTPGLQKAASEAMSTVLEKLGICPFEPGGQEALAFPSARSQVALKKIRAWKKSEKLRLKKSEDVKSNVTSSKVFWSKENLQKCSSLWQWEAKFNDYLKWLSKKETNRDEWMALTIYSAMTRGGLTKPEMVYSFYKQLHDGSVNWWTVADRCYVGLSHEVERGSFNLRIGADGAFRQMQWPIDMQTLTLVLAGPFHSNTGNCGLPLTEGAFISWLSGWFIEGAEAGFGSLRQLCKSVPFVQWFGLKAEISYAEAYITGPTQQNFTPNKASLISLRKAPNRIVWPELRSRSIDVKKVARRQRTGRLNSRFGDAATDMLLDLLEDAANRPTAIRKLQEFMIQNRDEWSLESRMLVQWLEYKLGHIKVSTAKYYVRKIGTEWFTAVHGCNFEDLDADGILAVYKRIHNGTNHQKRRESYIQSLRWLHQFGMEEYDWPINDALAGFLKTRTSLSYVRTSLVDHRHICNTLEALDRLEVEEIFRAQLKLILIIGFRCGIRIGEILKLRFRDIDATSDWSIYVRGSRLGSNKSDNSLRKLEFAKLASEEELCLLQQYYHELAVDRESPDYLFGLGGENIPLDQIKCSQQIGGALRQSTDNCEVVFHSLRHSWASNTLAIIGEEWSLAEELTGFGREKLVSIRRHWLRSNDLVRDGFWQLAKALGHATPAMSAQTYLHLVHEMLHLKVARTIWPTSNVRTSLKTLLNFRQGELDTLGYDLIMARLVKQVRKHTGEDRIPAKPGRRYRPNLTFDLPATYMILVNAIEKVESGQTISKVAEQYPVTEPDLEGMVRRCRKLAAMKTKAGAAKLINRVADIEAQIGAEKREALLPSLHGSPDVRRLAMDVANVLRQRCQKKRARKAIVRQAIAVLKTFTVSKHYLLIRSREDLAAILEFTQGLIPKEYWRFELKILVKREQEKVRAKRRTAFDYWTELSTFNVGYAGIDIEYGNKKSSHEHGVLYATLGHSKCSLEADRDTRRHGVKMLAWLAYMTMVIYGTNEEVRAFVRGI